MCICMRQEDAAWAKSKLAEMVLLVHNQSQSKNDQSTAGSRDGGRHGNAGKGAGTSTSAGLAGR